MLLLKKTFRYTVQILVATYALREQLPTGGGCRYGALQFFLQMFERRIQSCRFAKRSQRIYEDYGVEGDEHELLERESIDRTDLSWRQQCVDGRAASSGPAGVHRRILVNGNVEYGPLLAFTACLMNFEKLAHGSPQ